MSNILTGAKFGFEFTFCTTSTNPLGNWTEDIDEGKNITPEIATKYNNFVDSFSKALGSIKQDQPLEYKLSLPVYQLDFEDDFWITTSVDPKVIELQTKPISYTEIIDSKTTFDKIFDYFSRGTAYSIGNGGGHINVDYKSGFDGNFDLIKKTLYAAEIVVKNKIDDKSLKSEYRSLIDLGYLMHDPFLSHDRYDLVHPDKKPSNHLTHWSNNVYKASIRDFKEAHTQWLMNHPTTNQEDALSGKDQATREARAIHYQAINIEHIFEEEEDKKRLEFRFFKAQESVDDIIAGIELIDEIVTHAESL